MDRYDARRTRPFSSRRGRRGRPRRRPGRTACSPARASAYCSRRSVERSSPRIGLSKSGSRTMAAVMAGERWLLKIGLSSRSPIGRTAEGRTPRAETRLPDGGTLLFVPAASDDRRRGRREGRQESGDELRSPRRIHASPFPRQTVDRFLGALAGLPQPAARSGDSLLRQRRDAVSRMRGLSGNALQKGGERAGVSRGTPRRLSGRRRDRLLGGRLPSRRSSPGRACSGPGAGGCRTARSARSRGIVVVHGVTSSLL